MNRLVGPSLYVVAMVVLCFAPSVIAQQCPSEMQTGYMCLTSPGDGVVMGPAYIGPYVATIAGVGTSVDVICDDFQTDSSLYTPWAFTTETFATNLSSAKYYNTPTNPAPGAVYGTTGYEEVAWLSEQLVSNPTSACGSVGLKVTNAATSAECQGVLQYAIWSVFDPPALSSIDTTDANYATQLDKMAATPTNLDENFSNVTIYTANPKGVSQEFIVVNTPEPPALALLGVDLCGVVGAVFFFIRRGRKVAT